MGVVSTLCENILSSNLAHLGTQNDQSFHLTKLYSNSQHFRMIQAALIMVSNIILLTFGIMKSPARMVKMSVHDN